MIFTAVCTLTDVAPHPAPALAAIITACCTVCDVTHYDMSSPRRGVKVVHARHVFFWIAHNHTAKSFLQIGRAAGDRDHATVIHGVQKVERRYSFFAAEIAAVEHLLGMGR